MREILFRGKRIDNGEWIEGYYVKTVDYRTDSAVHLIIELPSAFYPRGEIAGEYEINSSTIGQYTGLTDKNGKKIFEGDVIRVKYSLCLPAGFGNSIRTVTHDIDFIATVIFDKCRFCLEKANGEICEMPLDSEAVEVIGNIHDNPELLKEKE